MRAIAEAARLAAVPLASVGLWAGVASAQWLEPPAALAPARLTSDTMSAVPDSARGPTTAALAADGAARRPRSWLAPVASAIIPGSGQLMLRQTRAVPYAALEIYAVTQFIRARRQARDRRTDYRDLARSAARARFGGPFPVGDFEYYERMETFLSSGEFDLTPGGALDPETDITTYNGSIWLLARRTFWGDPDVPPPPDSPQFQDAIDFYTRRAVGEQFRWSWEGAELEQDHFRRTIRRSNDAFRRASQFLGVALANHALAAVDAIITVRLQHTSSPDEERMGVLMTLPLGWQGSGR
ncbi:MAG TPA: hypothetical protein VJ812_00260 [Gemmatimonadaceae bacterium]|jgi:hypothetical protein|nr:hypothetical protein [Gemmatimonadaceae bacterium]